MFIIDIIRHHGMLATIIIKTSTITISVRRAWDASHVVFTWLPTALNPLCQLTILTYPLPVSCFLGIGLKINQQHFNTLCQLTALSFSIFYWVFSEYYSHAYKTNSTQHTLPSASWLLLYVRLIPPVNVSCFSKRWVLAKNQQPALHRQLVFVGDKSQ